MGILYRVEKKVYRGFSGIAGHWARIGIEALGEYNHRELDHQAASVSFFAIFSIFPLLAFLVFAVGELTGSAASPDTAPVVLGILKQLMPTMEDWIERGVLDIVRMTAVKSWINAALLGWSGLGFFGALLTAISTVPQSASAQRVATHRSKTVRTLLAAITFALSAVLVVTLVICEFLARSPQIPLWLQDLPYAYQDVIYWSGRSGLLLWIVSVATIAILFRVLLPCRIRLRHAITGATLCSAMLVISRSIYWIYLHYQATSIQSSYGAFSALVLNMLWIHFVVNCLLFSCLFAYQLDVDEKKAAGLWVDDSGSQTRIAS